MAQKRVTKPLFLKYGKFAGKSTITVSAALGVALGRVTLSRGAGVAPNPGTRVAPGWGAQLTWGWNPGVAPGRTRGWHRTGDWDGIKPGHLGGTGLDY